MKHDDPKMIDALAAEYVLGTLSGRARRRFERWRSKEWHVERRVQAWEERLSGLALRLSPMRPSPHVWSQIEKRIGPAGARTSTPPTQRVAPWQAIAASVALLAILVGGFFTYRSVVGPDLQPLARVVAPNVTESAGELSADADLRHLRARAGGGARAQPASVEVREEFGLVGRHVDLHRALPLAGLAGEAEVEGFDGFGVGPVGLGVAWAYDSMRFVFARNQTLG